AKCAAAHVSSSAGREHSSQPLILILWQDQEEGARAWQSEMDRAEITDLVLAEIPRLRRFARFLTHDLNQADYLVEECLTRALSRFDTRDVEMTLRAWLMAILH